MATRLRVRRLPREAATLPVLLILSALGWLLTGHLADPSMRIGILTSGPAMGEHDGMSGMSGDAMVMALGLFMATWVVMMVAMMLPSAAPVVLTFQRWSCARGRPASATAAFVAGYLAVWSAVGLVAYTFLMVLQRLIPAGNTMAVRVGGMLLLVTAVYQLTPLKDICLRHCRSPFSVIMQHAGRLSQGHVGPFRVGVVHGAYCVGCCWALMLILLLLGMMSLMWMGAVAAVVLAEKTLPWGRAVSRAVGVVVAGIAVALIAAPGFLTVVA